MMRILRLRTTPNQFATISAAVHMAAPSHCNDIAAGEMHETYLAEIITKICKEYLDTIRREAAKSNGEPINQAKLPGGVP